MTGRAGLVMLCLSNAGLAATAWLGGSPAAIAGCMLVFGLGMGCAFVSGTIASLRDVSRRDSGIAAGIQNISFSLGTTVGLAILSAISAAVIHSSQPGVQGHTGVLISGYSTAFICGALLGALGLAICTATYRSSYSPRKPVAGRDRLERVLQGHAGLGDDPGVAPGVRPGRGVHEERVAAEDVPGPAGCQRRRTPRSPGTGCAPPEPATWTGRRAISAWLSMLPGCHPATAATSK